MSEPTPVEPTAPALIARIIGATSAASTLTRTSAGLLSVAVSAAEEAVEQWSWANDGIQYLHKLFPGNDEALYEARVAVADDLTADNHDEIVAYLAKIIAFGLAGGVGRDGDPMSSVPFEDVLNKVRQQIWDLVGYSHGRRRKAFSAAESLEVFSRDDYKCIQCGAQRDLTVDHITPWSKGGSDEMFNLQTLCRSCNSRKGNRS